MENNSRFDDSPVSVYALGGLGEVGKNTYCVENNKTLIVIDAGVKFPEADMPGVNYVIPDYTHLKDESAKLKALIITHGHEDHIGGIPFLLQQVFIPVIYAPKLAMALIRHKLEEMKFRSKTKLVEYDGDSILKIDDFEISFFHVTHSIPDSFGIKIKTPEGIIVHTGDFKVDLTPVDHDIDLSKICRMGDEGVDLLLADSTNAEKEGYTQSEKSVISSINDIFRSAPGRLIISTFSSNISRIQQIVEAAIRYDRKIAIFGRSMESNIQAARDFGYIHIPDSSLINPDDLRKVNPSETLILCTGSQGEPLAALSRIANGLHRQIKIALGDTVVFSSSPIPGNTGAINKVVNQLTRCGATVLVNSVLNQLHASGHPCRQELRLMQKLMRPQYFMPIHGEYHMLKLHAEVAVECGMSPDHIFVMQNGDSIQLFHRKVTEGPKIHADVVYLDSTDATGLSSSVIKERKILSQDGVVAVTILLNKSKNSLLLPPVINTRGFSYFTSTSSTVVKDASGTLQQEINALIKTPYRDDQLSELIINSCSKYFYRLTHRNPEIVPLIMAENI
ncbi:MAG: ribonuclease J [Bacilli bacterium]|jgi:ribonuclease J|nr:ribonuclease J [Bacilli bacterium]